MLVMFCLCSWLVSCPKIQQKKLKCMYCVFMLFFLVHEGGRLEEQCVLIVAGFGSLTLCTSLKSSSAVNFSKCLQATHTINL
jgi:hypothetical protein